MQFYYFVTGMTADEFGESRPEVFGKGPQPVSHFSTAGPNDQNGFLVTVGAKRPQPKYDPDTQVWADSFLGFWIGYDKENKPTPETLQKPDMIEGWPVKLADENEYIIPVARSWNDPDKTTLPKSFVMGPDNTVLMKRSSDYEDFCQDAERLSELYLDIWFGELTSDIIPAADAFRMSCNALSINYELGDAEISCLELLDEKTRKKVFEASIDFTAIEKFAEIKEGKKKEVLSEIEDQLQRSKVITGLILDDDGEIIGSGNLENAALVTDLDSEM